jgi:exonuclease SbcC
MLINDKILESNNLKIIKDRKEKYLDYEYAITKIQKSGVETLETYSEYYIVNFSEKLYHYIFIDKADSVDITMKRFRDFQSHLLSTSFFSYRNDMRWNLYLILISNEKLDDYLIQKIEQDEDYARKYIFSEKETYEFLNKNWFNNNDNKKTVKVNPLHEWIDILAKENLTGCLGTYYSKKVEKYLKGNDFDDKKLLDKDYSDISNNNENIPIPQKITEIGLNNYRPHCFDNNSKIKPALINLFLGPNGSGKTSIMEAIEFALTSGNQRLSNMDNTNDNIKDVEIVCQDINKESKIFKPDKWNLKKLEEKWYGIPAGRSRETLNYNLSKFNYFDADAAYRFALEESDEKDGYDYSDGLSRLMFGEDVVKRQKNWKRYKDEFDSKKLGINKNISDLKEQIEKFENEKGGIEKNKDFNINETITLIEELNIDESKLSSNNFKSNDNWLKAIVDTIDSLAHQLELIDNYETEKDRLTLSNINDSLNDFKNKLVELQEKEKCVLEDIEEIKKLKEENDIKNKKIEEKNDEIKTTEKVEDKWEKYRVIINNKEKIDIKNKLEEEIENSKNNKSKISFANENWSHISDFKLKDISVMEDKELNLLKDNLKQKEETKENIDEQIKQLEFHYEELESIKTELNNLGEKYLELEDNNSICPLCGHDHNEREHLVSSIKQTLNKIDDSKLAKTKRKQDAINVELKKLRQQIKNEENKRDNNKNLIDLIVYLNEKRVAEIDLEQDKTLLLNAAKEKLNSESELTKKINEKTRNLKSLKNEGFSDENIEEAIYFEKNNEYFIRYKERNQVIDIDNEFREYLVKYQEKLREEISKLENDLKKNEMEIKIKSDDKYEKKLQNIRKDIDKFKEKVNENNELLSKIKSISKYFDIAQNQNIKSWITKIFEIKERARVGIKRIEKNKELEELNNNINKANLEIDELKNQLKRCKIACKIFDQLKYLKVYTDDFIEDNIERIKKFFNLIHTPREFNDLILEERSIKIFRESSKVKATEISSGQRVSLALSILFTLHLAAPNTPRFIILDEPIANLDDLHLLNLLDILRDLAANGRQIFFTTANPEVANIFRRKFSFFREKFKFFELNRYGNSSVKIETKQFSPEEEEAVEIRA